MGWTGAQLVARIRWAADIESNTARHTDAALFTLLNQSIAVYRRILDDAGSDTGQVLTGYTTTASVPTVALAPTERIGSITVTLNNITNHIHYAGVHEQASYQSSGRPASWRMRASDATTGGQCLVLFPTPDAAYALSVSYLPTQTDVTSSSTWYPDIRGAEDFVVYDAASKIAARDMHPRLPALQAERDRQEAYLRAQASRHLDPGHRTDTRSQRRVADLLARRRA